MSVIPLHLQRKFEQRWAARFVAPVAPAVPKSNLLRRNLNTLQPPAKEEQKPAELTRRPQ